MHLNLAFREPLLGLAGQLPPPRTAGRTWHEVRRGPFPDLSAVRDQLRPSARGVIVAGHGRKLGGVVEALASELSWPVLADPRSGYRTADTHVVGAADAMLRDERFATEMLPDVVLRCGDPWMSKVLGSWLSRSAREGAVHVALDPDWAWKDAGREVAVFVRAGSSAGGSGARPAGAWLRRWADAETAAQSAIDGVLDARSEASEPGVARALFAAVPGSGTIVVSSSMPGRDLEWFSRPRSRPPRVLANRGANGIDGVVSTTLGVAASGTGAPVFGLLGDLAVLHDASALVRPASGAPSMAAVMVVLDNAGGGIFNFLPQASELEETEFEQLFGTPQHPAVTELARGCGLFVTDVTAAAQFLPALAVAGEQAARTGLPAFVVVHTERKANVALHAEIEGAVGAALSELSADDSYMPRVTQAPSSRPE